MQGQVIWPWTLDRLTQPCEQGTRTDLDEGQGEERLMDLRATLVADAEPPVLVGPGQRPLHRPAGLAQPRVLIDPLLRHDRLDPHLPQPLAVRLAVRPGPPARRRASA